MPSSAQTTMAHAYLKAHEQETENSNQKTTLFHQEDCIWIDNFASGLANHGNDKHDLYL